YQRDAEAGIEVSAHRVAGGFSQLADGMAAALGDVVRYGEMVVGLDQSGEQVTVR
ncbi:MAG TPA: amine oxidase, partial [Acidimicrobiaceae bacterium]|nr:amine oxidase [Acidimicrobiaceae bacterium]